MTQPLYPPRKVKQRVHIFCQILRCSPDSIFCGILFVAGLDRAEFYSEHRH